MQDAGSSRSGAPGGQPPSACTPKACRRPRTASRSRPHRHRRTLRLRRPPALPAAQLSRMRRRATMLWARCSRWGPGGLAGSQRRHAAPACLPARLPARLPALMRCAHPLAAERHRCAAAALHTRSRPSPRLLCAAGKTQLRDPPPAGHVQDQRTARAGAVCHHLVGHAHGAALVCSPARPAVGAAQVEPLRLGGVVGGHQEDGQARGPPLLGETPAPVTTPPARNPGCAPGVPR